MKLNEFFTYGTDGFEQDKTYEPENDISILDSEDTRKTRLTLKQINSMRLASEAHDAQQKEALANPMIAKVEKALEAHEDEELTQLLGDLREALTQAAPSFDALARRGRMVRGRGDVSGSSWVD